MSGTWRYVVANWHVNRTDGWTVENEEIRGWKEDKERNCDESNKMALVLSNLLIVEHSVLVKEITGH